MKNNKHTRFKKFRDEVLLKGFEKSPKMWFSVKELKKHNICLDTLGQISGEYGVYYDADVCEGEVLYTFFKYKDDYTKYIEDNPFY